MFKKIIIIFFIGILNINNSAFSDDKILKSLKEGKKLIFIRHAIAPGNGDPNNFDINDCSTQRNLDEKGIEESEKIGLFFKNNKIKIDKVLSSQWCRCKDTAKYAFEKYKTFNALNSFFSEKFQKNRKSQMADLSNFLKKWDDEKNLVLVTHYVVILDIANQPVSSGEIVILDKNLNLIGTMLL